MVPTSACKSASGPGAPPRAACRDAKGTPWSRNGSLAAEISMPVSYTARDRCASEAEVTDVEEVQEHRQPALMVWVKETATRPRDTLVRVLPSECTTASGLMFLICGRSACLVLPAGRGLTEHASSPSTPGLIRAEPFHVIWSRGGCTGRSLRRFCWQKRGQGALGSR